MSEYQKITQSVSFVVLALNEQKVVEQVVREIHSTVDALINTYEIILINDGSTDRTGEIMEMLSRELTNTRVRHNNPNRGLGGSYKRGVEESRHARSRLRALPGNCILRPFGDDHTDLHWWLGDQGKRAGYRIWVGVGGTRAGIHVVSDIRPARHAVFSGRRFAGNTDIFPETD